MKQLVAGGGQAPGDSPTGERVGTGGWGDSLSSAPFLCCPWQSRTVPLRLGVHWRRNRVLCHQPATGCSPSTAPSPLPCEAQGHAWDCPAWGGW